VSQGQSVIQERWAGEQKELLSAYFTKEAGRGARLWPGPQDLILIYEKSVDKKASCDHECDQQTMSRYAFTIWPIGDSQSWEAAFQGCIVRRAKKACGANFQVRDACGYWVEASEQQICEDFDWAEAGSNGQLARKASSRDNTLAW